MFKICQFFLLNIISIAWRKDHFLIKCQIQSILLLMLKAVHYYDINSDINSPHTAY